MTPTTSYMGAHGLTDAHAHSRHGERCRLAQASGVTIGWAESDPHQHETSEGKPPEP